MDIAKVKRLVEFDTPTVANGLERLGLRDPTLGYTGPDVRSLMPEFGPRVGVAVTARLDTTTAGVDDPPSLWKDWLRLIRDAGATGLPVFAVMESVGPRARHTVTIGDGMGTLMLLAGVNAFITNGSIRDLEGVRGIGLACWAAGLAPMHGRLRWLDVNSPVVIDGMTVRPGEILHADINGAITIPAQVADQVFDQAVAVRRREAELFAGWRSPDFNIDRYLAE